MFDGNSCASPITDLTSHIHSYFSVSSVVRSVLLPRSLVECNDIASNYISCLFVMLQLTLNTTVTS